MSEKEFQNFLFHYKRYIRLRKSAKRIKNQNLLDEMEESQNVLFETYHRFSKDDLQKFALYLKSL